MNENQKDLYTKRIRMIGQHPGPGLSAVQDVCFSVADAAGWWDMPDGIYCRDSNHWRDVRTPIALALIHSEISEGMEGFRKNLKDDHLPERDMLEVELADAMIRIMDLAGAHGYDLEAAIREKLLYNLSRQDHTKEARAGSNGKRF